jgi:CRP/FNR family cyclic AMP-dependent transcriptional regulator
VERDALIRLMEKNGEFGLHASQALSREFQSAYRDIHDLVLGFSAGKLARLLLSWTPIREKFGAPEIHVRASVTHEEMAQMIGSSRETVTRLLSELKKKEFIRLDGSTLVAVIERRWKRWLRNDCCSAVDGRCSSPAVCLLKTPP